MDEEILSGLLKRAKGYSYQEVQEEYSVKDDGEIALTKRKVTKKYCPPDASALKTYMELNADRGLEEYSDEELEEEKNRLLGQLKIECENQIPNGEPKPKRGKAKPKSGRNKGDKNV